MTESKDYIGELYDNTCLTQLYFQIVSGVAHGEDVLLIYAHHFRDIPYSEEETAIGQNLIDLHYNFAKHNKAVYGSMNIEKTKVNDIKCLEINSLDDYKMIQLDDDFGNMSFWDEIEEFLVANEKKFNDELWNVSESCEVCKALKLVRFIGTHKLRFISSVWQTVWFFS